MAKTAPKLLGSKSPSNLVVGTGVTPTARPLSVHPAANDPISYQHDE